mgnify:CR=1 FL=1
MDLNAAGVGFDGLGEESFGEELENLVVGNLETTFVGFLVTGEKIFTEENEVVFNGEIIVLDVLESAAVELIAF